ncbi:MAG: hypothetical protein AAGE01_08670 [Pseudomonadota bacterium]
MDLVEACRPLNRSRLSAAPCAWIPAISIFVDERYDRSDVDVLGPQQRQHIARVLGRHGWRQLTGGVFAGPHGRLVLPRLTPNLSEDPGHAFAALRGGGRQAALATPTQVIFLTLTAAVGGLDAERENDLLDLVHEQPANLDKVAEWLRRSSGEGEFDRIRVRLAARQEEGRLLREQHAFRSRLPA